MSVVLPDEDHTIPRIDFELSAACDHKCAHCYNVWTAKSGDAQAGYDIRAQLRTASLLKLMTKAIEQSGAQHVTITGGEPLLRQDALKIIRHACELVHTVTLISNGSHIPPESAADLADMGVRQVQLTLLAGNRELHDELKGAVCFDDTVRAALDLRDAGVPVQVCYVSMKQNAGELERVMELCVALGVKALSYNRMSPTGGAIHHIERLLPTMEIIEADLTIADRMGRAYGIHVGTAMPVMPCLIRYERFPWIQFGLCSTGTEAPNIVVDGQGNVRSCNLSSGIMGNLVTQDWAEIYSNPYQKEFRRTVPEMCRGCAYETTCQGGCKESAYATFGSHEHPEPLLFSSVVNAK